MTARQFYAVAFDGEDSVAVVPDIWINEDGGCCWPPYKSLQRLQTAVVKEEVPGQDWDCHNCRVLYSGSYNEAEKRLRKAEETSDIQSHSDSHCMETIPAKRTKIARRGLAESSDESDEETRAPQLPTSRPPTYLRALPTSPPALSGPVNMTPRVCPSVSSQGVGRIQEGLEDQSRDGGMYSELQTDTHAGGIGRAPYENMMELSGIGPTYSQTN